MATNNYEINYDDQRFKAVEAEKTNALSDVEKTYSGMANQSDAYYQQQIDAVNQWGETQKKLQNEQTNFAIEEINQQKQQAYKDYQKEQSASYVDWQKQSNEYGANAEAIAQQGMNLTGYSESSQVSMYNTYQNRVATARESYNQVVMNYNNAITEARLQNNSALAEIAFQTLQTGLELSLAGFQYKNTLLLDQMDKKLQVDEMYYGRWQDVLDQMNTENSMAEQIRQYNESLAEDIRQHNESLAEDKRQFDASLAEDQRQFDLTHAGYGGGGGGGGSSSSSKKSSSSSGDSPKIEKTKTGGNNAPVPNMQSLIDAGYAGKSANSIEKAVQSGNLIEVERNGQVYYHKGSTDPGAVNKSGNGVVGLNDWMKKYANWGG